MIARLQFLLFLWVCWRECAFCFALRYRWIGALRALDTREVGDGEDMIIDHVHRSMNTPLRLQAA